MQPTTPHRLLISLIMTTLALALGTFPGPAASAPSDLSASTKASLPEGLLEAVREALGPQDTHAMVVVDDNYSIYLPIVMREFIVIFELQIGSPVYIPDERGCEHMGVGGKVYDSEGAPIVGLAVRMGGELGGMSIGLLDTLTGSAADRFGYGGYYFELSDEPVASEGTLWIQVLDPSSGLPLSNKVLLNTFENCEQNLVFVNWQQVGE